MTVSADAMLAPAQSPDARRDELVEAAYALLADHGLEGLTVRAVLQRTGLARRAFYERFEGKDDLVLALFRYAIERAAAFYGERFETITDPLDRLELVVVSIAEGTLGPHGIDRRGAALSREHLRLAESRPRELQSALLPLLELIEQVLADGMAAGKVRTASPPRLAALIYNVVSTTAHAELLARSDGTATLHAGPSAEDLWEFCRRAILP